MRTITLVICFLVLALQLSAQQTVTVISGQVFYFPELASKPILKTPGTQFDLKGKLRCKNNESAKLVYNGHYFWITGSKLRYVQDVVNAAVKTNELSFTGRFFNFLTESVKEGENPENVKKYHRKYMKTSGGISGFGRKDDEIETKKSDEIEALWLTCGILLPANVIFKWRNTPGQGPYSFKLLSADGNAVAHLILRDTAVTLDLDQLALNLDENYTWTVTRNDTLKSAAIPFKLWTTSTVEGEIDLSNKAAYKAASPMEQQLMLAFLLEEECCYYAANSTYVKLLDADPENQLIRKMYATFLARMDMLPEASAILANSPK